MLWGAGGRASLSVEWGFCLIDSVGFRVSVSLDLATGGDLQIELI